MRLIPGHRYRIVCHPENIEILKKHLEPGMLDTFDPTFELTPSPHMNRFKRKWQFPKERFIEYEEKDESWARPLGFGKEVETNEREYYIVDLDAFRIQMFDYPSIIRPRMMIYPSCS